jgi:hypothetical protein
MLRQQTLNPTKNAIIKRVNYVSEQDPNLEKECTPEEIECKKKKTDELGKVRIQTLKGTD